MRSRSESDCFRRMRSRTISELTSYITHLSTDEDLIKYGFEEDVWFHTDKVRTREAWLSMGSQRVLSLPLQI